MQCCFTQISLRIALRLFLCQQSTSICFWLFHRPITSLMQPSCLPLRRILHDRCHTLRGGRTLSTNSVKIGRHMRIGHGNLATFRLLRCETPDCNEGSSWPHLLVLLPLQHHHKHKFCLAHTKLYLDFIPNRFILGPSANTTFVHLFLQICCLICSGSVVFSLDTSTKQVLDPVVHLSKPLTIVGEKFTQLFSHR